MPYRRAALEEQRFVIVWQELDSDPRANAERVLAFDNGSLLARLGMIWVVRGDLRLQRMSRDDLQALGVTVP